MKNLLIYINPSKQFDDEHTKMARIQIDNSLALGWHRDDIIIVTNFDYEYNGVKSMVVDDDNFCIHWPSASKINTILTIFEQGLIEPEVMWWFHDFDAFQLATITPEELELDTADMGLTDYGRLPRWSTGSIFFKLEALDIFKLLKEKVYSLQTDEERALDKLTGTNQEISNRVKKINITYNLALRNLRSTYQLAIKPIRVIHFHPIKYERYFIECFMYGKNKLDKVIMTDSLIRIFKDHGVE